MKRQLASVLFCRFRTFLPCLFGTFAARTTEQLVDVLQIVERVVEKELQLWDDAQLMTLQLTHLIADLGGVLIDVLKDFLCLR